MFDESKKNVLILEDTPSVEETLESDIRSLGYVPHIARDRPDFIDLYLNIPAYAIILDNNVPHYKGEEARENVGIMLASHILRREPQAKIALHTERERNEAIETLEKSGVRYLLKPVSINELRDFLD